MVTSKDMRKAPQSAVMIAIYWPGLVEGTKSPYPTVVKVMVIWLIGPVPIA